MSSLYRQLVLSSHPLARRARSLYHSLHKVSIPAPKLIVRPILSIFLIARSIYYFLIRIFVCEPLFKAYCTQYGTNVHTGVFLHWIQGRGALIVGDNVVVDGKCSFLFAVRYAERPILLIGNNVRIGHNCTFTIGREIVIGENVMIGMNVDIFDSPGHPTDPASRIAGLPALPGDVKPIRIERKAWIGSGAIIYPGITVGEAGIVARGAIVMSDVPPYTIVAGNPARQIARVGRENERGVSNGQTGCQSGFGGSKEDYLPIAGATSHR